MKYAISIFCLAASVYAGAAPGGNAAAESPADQLARLQAQRTINRVRVDVAKQEAELRDAGKSATAAAQPGPGAAPPPPSPAGARKKAAEPEAAPAPVVVSISAVGDQASAVVVAGGLRRGRVPGPGG